MEDLLKKSLELMGKSQTCELQDELDAIMTAQDRVSPLYITELDSDEIFVFGSNLQGQHFWRASNTARTNFDAERGKGDGMSGRSYAIPTTEMTLDISDWEEDEIMRDIEKKDNKLINTDNFIHYEPSQIAPYIDKFIDFARNHSELKFFVTRVGCGYNMKEDTAIAPLFKEALKLKNVYLPQSFLDELFDIDYGCENPSELVPFEGTGIANFAKEMERRILHYLRWLRKQQGAFSNDEWIKIIDTAGKICDKIIKAVDLSLRGVPSSAYHAIEELMEKDVKPIFEQKGIDLFNNASPKLFYRMRVEKDNWTKKDVDNYGMFHIPFSKRDMVKTQRYSVPGYPCLYLAEHIFGCWVECGRPNLSECLISAFKKQKDFKVLDLRIPSESQWNQRDEKTFIKTAILFPIVIACTFKSANTKAVYKPEYIIPQLFLQYVKESGFKMNKDVIDKDMREVYGISYTSVNIPNCKDSRTNSDIFNFSPDVYNNYVIPVIDIKHDYCSRLRSLFTMTKPICEEFERLDSHHKQREIIDSIEDLEEEVGARYASSIFGKLEAILSNRSFSKL